MAKSFNKKVEMKKDQNQKGTATIIAVLIMSLMTGFVALSVGRTTNESRMLSDDVAEAKTFAVAQASLENMTLEADNVFDSKLDLETTDELAIEAKVPTGFPSNYTFTQNIRKVRAAEVVDATERELQGLKAIRDEWELSTAVKDTYTGVQSILRRRFFNNRVPLFQFGVFYDDDLDFSSAPRFDFGGRVHSNGNFFASSWSGLYFSSRITVKGEVVTDILSSGRTPFVLSDETFIKDADGIFQRLRQSEGSALGSTVNGGNLFWETSWRPPAYTNTAWAGVKPRYDNNLLNQQNKLNLPLKSGYVDMVRRGKNLGDVFNDGTGTVAAPTIIPVTTTNQDTTITKKERYYNKVGLRISLADSKTKLPGCNGVVGVCGVRLDGNILGTGDIVAGTARGYQPLALADGTVSTRVNGERLFIPGKENWIKIELVATGTFGTPITNDVTADILSLGVTERAEPVVVSASQGFAMAPLTYTTNADRYSIIKLQRFMMPGSEIKASSEYLTSMNWNSLFYNFVVASVPVSVPVDTITPDKNPQSYFNTRFGCHDTQLTTPPATSPCAVDNVAHHKAATINGVANRMVVPFPIMTFDTREGIPFETNDTSSALYPTTLFPNGKVPLNGVMSVVDIDVTNLRKFLNGDFNNLLPSTTQYALSKSPAMRLLNTDVPTANGWVVYFSDRRGDFDFDGEYDMEDIYADSAGVLNSGLLSPGEDVNNNLTLQADYVNEAPYYSEKIAPDVASVVNTRFYRRSARLINGTIVPGNYDAANPSNTKGFTFAAENGVYIKGNLNATGVASYGTPTPPTDYLPQNTVNHIPTSVAGDATTVLSGSWQDANAFRFPFDYSKRVASETTVRFGDITGDARSFAPCGYDTINAGSQYPCFSGGVHNLNRFLETWSGKKLNYTGSLINLFDSRNNNGGFKCCQTVYSPPQRNFAFDISFLDPYRLPPGTPFVQSIQVTGFQRVNE